jgi:hypothetical protein
MKTADGTQIAQPLTWFGIKSTGVLVAVLGLIGIAVGAVVAIPTWAVMHYCRKRTRRTQELRDIELQARERHEQRVRVDTRPTRVTESPRVSSERAELSLDEPFLFDSSLSSGPSNNVSPQIHLDSTLSTAPALTFRHPIFPIDTLFLF